jgi:tetratricopeptide (TPR) repeat protein
MMFNAASPPAQPQAPQQPQNNPTTTSTSGELPDWLTGILNESDKTPAVAQQSTPPAPQPVAEPPKPSQPLPEQPAQQPVAPSWLTEDAKPANATRTLSSGEQPAVTEPPQQAPTPTPPQQAAQVPPASQPPVAPVAPVAQTPMQIPQPVDPTPAPAMSRRPDADSFLTVPPPSSASKPAPNTSVEDLLNQIAGAQNGLAYAAEPVLASTASLPDNVRVQVVRSMQDIQRYINHDLLSSATEECLRVIDMAPQYLDVHQVLCEIYVREGKIEQAITKYAILVDTYIVNGRVDDAVSTYRRILQLEPNNLKYRMRLIDLLSSHGQKEDLLRERTLAAESYLRLGYMDRALTELEQALKESPTSVPTRLNYALALQKLGRTQQAVAEYQRVLQIDPRNITALVRWHIAMVTGTGVSRSTSLEILNRIRWQLRGEGQKRAEAVIHEYQEALEIYPNNADIHFALGQIYHQTGNFERAVDAYLQAAGRDNSVEVLARASAAQCFFIQGRPDRVIEQLEQALQIVRRSPTAIDPATWAARPREDGEEHKAPEVELSTQLAKAYERTGRHEQKEAILRQLKQTRPVSNEVSSAMAQISSRQGDANSALQEQMDLVRHYRNSRQIDNALNVLNEMVRLTPQDPRAHEELADISINRGMLEDGIAELRLLADIYIRRGQMQQAGEVVQRMGNIYSDMGNTDEAFAALCRAAELYPESMDLLREVVGFCLQLNHYTEATNYQTIIARHYFDTHQVKESVAALQQLITIDRNNFEAYDMLGQTYESVGEYEQASRVYRNLAKANPSSSTARERLATLQSLRSSQF